MVHPAKPMGLGPNDMDIVDRIFTKYVNDGQSDTDARISTSTYLVRVFGWDHDVAMRAASIAMLSAR